MTTSYLRPLLLALALLPTAGCGLFSDDVKPIYEIDDDDIVVVHPFSDPDFDSAWDSQTGHELARRTTEVLSDNAPFVVVPYDEVALLMHAPAADDGIGLDVRTLTPAKLAELTGADYVVMADILSFQLRDPRSVALHQASGFVDVKLFKLARSSKEKRDAAKDNERRARIRAAYARHNIDDPRETVYGGKMVAGARIEAIYPDTYLDQYGAEFLDPLTARAGLIRVLGKRAAQLFFEHEPEKLGATGY